jgi:hypothetical protein
MTPDDFRRIALSFPDTEEGSHFGAADFRTGGRIFATLAMQAQGYGNLMITPEMQADFIADRPDLFLPVHGGWGRMGITHIRLAEANEDTLTGALYTAYKHRVQRNQSTSRKGSKPRKG